MAVAKSKGPGFPLDPLANLTPTAEDRRRVISGILESYNSNYDFIAEAIQNAVDAAEDAKILKLKGPFQIGVTVNLQTNSIEVLDTGIGMSTEQVTRAFAPHVSFKHDSQMISKRGQANAYRGYKGVGLTYLAYGTDDIRLHSKQDGVLVKGRMQYGLSWSRGERTEVPLIVEDDSHSPLDKLARGTYLRIQFSKHTRPKSLTHLASEPMIWPTILRTRTAIGQIHKQATGGHFDVNLNVVGPNGRTHVYQVDTDFYLPHLVSRSPPFRFLDLPAYYAKHPEQSRPPAEKLRQDGLYLEWDTPRIRNELTEEQLATFESELSLYSPRLYAFIPYQGSVWGEINEILAGVKNRNHLYPGLLVAVNRQRLADKFEIEATRFETFSRNAFIIVHFENAKPDQGRKTLQDEVIDLARRAADRAIQYLAKQRELLKPAGDAPTPGQRDVEKTHEDWLFNVRTHAKQGPLHIPPVSYVSTPLTEQDVVGLFHQMTALGVFPGIKVYSTSQIRTYDCLAQFDCSIDLPGLKYSSPAQDPLGVSPRANASNLSGFRGFSP
jgi:hypothetical protein